MKTRKTLRDYIITPILSIGLAATLLSCSPRSSIEEKLAQTTQQRDSLRAELEVHKSIEKQRQLQDSLEYESIRWPLGETFDSTEVAYYDSIRKYTPDFEFSEVLRIKVDRHLTSPFSKRFFADINGDGYDDLVSSERKGDTIYFRLYKNNLGEKKRMHPQP